jgi:pyrimidine-nucleoside phosphorylase
MTDELNVPRLIERKRDGGALTDGEWRALIAGYVGGSIPDYQLAALAMAIMFQGLEPAEIAALTGAMVDSGARFDLAALPGPVVDKHSTGGIGDKTSLLLAPMLASLDVVVPMVAGRGLGHTGGTLDKLESIPGFRTGLSLGEARNQLDRAGAFIMGQTPELVPADRKLYALRDVSGSVESLPLIAASVMSKKLAEDLDGLVLDVKTGSGAFITDPARSLELARTMIELGERRGCRTVGLLTAMDRPLGIACGNALEVREAIAGLGGAGPADLMEVTVALAIEMLQVARPEIGRHDARRTVEGTIASGAAIERFRRLIAAQGGDPRVVDEPDRLPRAPHREPLRSPRDGTVVRVEPRAIGHAIIGLGGGRRLATDTIDPAVGVEVLVKPGDRVDAGAPLAIIHAGSVDSLEQARRALSRAIPIGEEAEPQLPLIGPRVTIDGTQPLGPE